MLVDKCSRTSLGHRKNVDVLDLYYTVYKDLGESGVKSLVLNLTRTGFYSRAGSHSLRVVMIQWVTLFNDSPNTSGSEM